MTSYAWRSVALAAALGSATLPALGILAIPTIAGAQDDQTQRKTRSFIDGIGGLIFEAAWPTATYEKIAVHSITPVAGGFDATVRLSGWSSWGNKGPLRLDLLLMLRGGSLHDIRVKSHNALLAEPFTTTKTIASFLLEVGAAYAQAPRQSGAPVRRSYYTIQVANRCQTDISVWLRFQGTSGDWRTSGDWKIGASTVSALADPTLDNRDTLRVLSRVVYSYAKPITVSGFNWAGNRNVEFGGATLPMRTDTLVDDGTGMLLLTRQCENIEPLGVTGENAGRYEYQGVTYTSGARLTRVWSGSAAERMGLRAGDVIYYLNGQVVTDWPTLIKYVYSYAENPFDVHVIRGAVKLRIDSPALSPR